MRTDKTHEIPDDINELLGERLNVIYLPHEPWPMPTLKRYRFLLDIFEVIKSPVVMYLDADMLIDPSIDFSELINLASKEGLVVVQHPGYFRPKGKVAINYFLRNPFFLLKDAFRVMRLGGNGAWETNQNSTSFLPRKMRSTYFCGGVWFGEISTIFRMCTELSTNIDIDLSSNIVAKFHDESHLNWFVAKSKFANLSPAYCFVETYQNLDSLVPKIYAVEKSGSSKWIR